MQIKSNLITAVVTAFSVVALTWNPAADAAAPPSNSISVCVNKKSGAMRSASSCAKSERKILVAEANVKLSAPAPVQVAQIPTSRALKSAPQDAEVSLAELAGESVQTVVSRVTVPNLYGSELASGVYHSVDFPSCPTEAPVRISTSAYSSNYPYHWEPNYANLPMNPDETVAMQVNGTNVQFGAWHTPKNGDMDLYLVTLCAPILVVQ